MWVIVLLFIHMLFQISNQSRSLSVAMSNPSPAVAAAWDSAVEQLKSGPPASHFILLENPFKAGQTVASMNTQYVLSLKHFLLPLQVGKTVEKLATDIRKMGREWMGGGTSCGDAVWFRFMIPKLGEAQNKIEMKQWKKAFGILLGLQLFASHDDDWIRDQEVYTEFGEFAGWFSGYSAAWLQLLERSDNQLGLVTARGREGGYRGVVREMLENWERKTNELFKEVFDEFADDDRVSRSRVRLFSDAGSSDEEVEDD